MNPNRLEQVVELNQQGMLNKDIAGYLNISPTQVYDDLEKANIEKTSSIYHPSEEEQLKRLQDIVELNQQGLTNKNIGKHLDISSPTVTVYLNKVGLQRNDDKSKPSEEEQLKRLQDIVELNQQGWRNNDIWVYLNVDSSTVDRYLKKVNLKGYIEEVKKERIFEENTYTIDDVPERFKEKYTDPLKQWVTSRIKNREYYKNNKEKCAKQKKKYYENNKEHVAEVNKKRYERKKEEILQQKKEYYQNNKIIILKKRKEYGHIPEVRENKKLYQKGYRKRPEVIANRQTKEFKEQQKISRNKYMENGGKEKSKEYSSRPEIKERDKKRQKKWNEENKERNSEWHKQHSKKPKVMARRRKLDKIRSKKDSIKKSQRTLLWSALNRFTDEGKIHKSSHYGVDYEGIINKLEEEAQEIYGKTIQEMREMGFQNDHIIPLSAYKFQDENGVVDIDEVTRSERPFNIRWLSAKENIEKNNKIRPQDIEIIMNMPKGVAPKKGFLKVKELTKLVKDLYK